jgi:prepilin-type N-terminal cleavage/methylation domain-containing protein
MRHAARGFSLLEMLLVLFVVVVITSLVSLNIGSAGGGRDLQRQIQGLRALAEYALDEAQFSGRDLGLLLQRGSGSEGVGQLWLRWRERLPQGWRPVERDRELFADVAVPGSVQLELLLEGSTVLPADAAAADARAGTEPQWRFFSSGETDAGEMLWSDTDSGELLWRLEWDALGRFSLYRGDDVEVLGADATR